MTQTGGAPVPDSTTNTAQFSLFNVATGGTPLWTESDIVASKNGLFTVELGHGSILTLPFDQPYWLEISWWGTTMSPRQPLDTAPYAFRAAVADNATTATSAVSLQVPQSLSFSTPGAAVLSGTNATGTGLQGQGGVAGVLGQAGASGGSGVYADYNGIGGAYALSVSGPARFMGGPVSFTGSVDFSGATVTGLANAGVAVPLSLTGAVPAPSSVLLAQNTGTGSAANFTAAGAAPTLMLQGATTALSATVSNLGPAVYVQAWGGGFKPALLAVTGGTGHAVEGDNSQFGAVGLLGGAPLNGNVGVYGTGPYVGVQGESGASMGVLGHGSVGVEGQVTLTGQTAILADGGGLAGSYALKVSGPAQFFGGPVSFTGSVDFTGATVTGLAGGVTAPLDLSGTTPLGAAVIQGANLGAGYGVAGSDSQPGTQDINGNPLTITAGVFGSTASVDSAGVFGVSTAVTSTAGVAGRGLTGVYGESNGYGVGGEFYAVSGTGAQGRGLTGVAGAAELPGGVGVVAWDGGQSGALALEAQGGSVFNGPVTFNGAVTGLGGSGVSAPLNLTFSSGTQAVITAANLGAAPGLSVTSAGGAAVVAQGAAMGMIVQGTSNFTTVVGLSATAINSNFSFGSAMGVYGNAGGSPTVNKFGVYGDGASGIGVYGSGGNGVYGTSAQGVGVYGQSSGGAGGTFQGLTGVVISNAALGLSITTQAGAGPALYTAVNSFGPAVSVANAGSGAGINVDGTLGGGSGINVNMSSSNAVVANSIQGNALYATSSNPSGAYALWATNQNGGTAVRGESYNPGGIGIWGNGYAVGVSATATGLTGVALVALGPVALSATGNAVFNGAANSITFNTAVFFNGPVTGLSAGVTAPLDLTSTSSAAAVFGENVNGGPGVAGKSDLAGGSGVQGIAGVAGASAMSAVGMTIGLSATASDPAGVAVYGRVSGSAAALQIQNDGSGPAALLQAGSDYALRANAVYGVSITAHGGYGVFAQSDWMGIYADGLTSYGVFGETASGGSPAIKGYNDSNGFGMYSYSTSGPSLGVDGYGLGVSVTVRSPTGVGLYGRSNSSAPVIQAINDDTSAGVGGYFQGVTGVVAVSQPGGVALYVSGAVKTSMETVGSTPSSTWNVAATGSTPIVNLVASASAAVTSIVVTDPLVSTNSVVSASFVGWGSAPTTGYTVVVANGSFTFYPATSLTITGGKAINFLIVN